MYRKSKPRSFASLPSLVLVSSLVLLLSAWHKVSSILLGPRCRFHPTCSEYSVEALKRYGVLKGSWLTLKRVVRCQPLCAGGVDEVP